ncbi:MAG: ATP-dependent Clp protease proteolytic subunit [Planctomycetota bacterium]
MTVSAFLRPLFLSCTGLSLAIGLTAAADAQDTALTAEKIVIQAPPQPEAPVQIIVETEPTNSDTTESETSEADSEIDELKKLLAQLQLEAQLRTQQLEAELAEAKAENQRLKQTYDLAQQQQKSELQPLQQEKARIDLELGLEKSRRTAESAPLDAELAELTKQKQLREAKLASELAELQSKTQKLQATQALADAERRAELAAIQHEHQLLTVRNEKIKQELAAERLQAEADQARAMAKLKLANASVQQRQADEKLDNTVEEELVYRDEPFDDGVLYISDRRIPLNGPIITGTADYVTDRIHFFNNENADAPIFLVIDNCPGGSVMEGYRIVKAIEASDAPIHVVVKSFAASMAAIITTLADHSYAYPNAIMLHHQMSAGAFGNMTDIEDQFENLREWEARLAVPVAEKMGVSPERFREMMYEDRASGDWDEFADRAVELKWVNAIVNEVREEGVRTKPAGEAPKPWYWSLFAQDEHGQTYVNLPPLAPMDAYMMYNPRNFYRVDGR